MNFKLILLLMLLLITGSLMAQHRGLPVFETRHKNVYGELFGSHILTGANFDMRLKKGSMDGIGFRVGIGGASLTGTEGGTQTELGLVTFPIEFNHIVGKRRSGFVTGVGVLPLYVNASKGEATFPDTYEYIKRSGFGVVGFLNIGYRLQPLKNGFMMQINWNPVISQDGFSASWIGIGLGIGFK